MHNPRARVQHKTPSLPNSTTGDMDSELGALRRPGMTADNIYTTQRTGTISLTIINNKPVETPDERKSNFPGLPRRVGSGLVLEEDAPVDASRRLSAGDAELHGFG